MPLFPGHHFQLCARRTCLCRRKLNAECWYSRSALQRTRRQQPPAAHGIAATSILLFNYVQRARRGCTTIGIFRNFYGENSPEQMESMQRSSRNVTMVFMRFSFLLRCFRFSCSEILMWLYSSNWNISTSSRFIPFNTQPNEFDFSDDASANVLCGLCVFAFAWVSKHVNICSSR